MFWSLAVLLLVVSAVLGTLIASHSGASMVLVTFDTALACGAGVFGVTAVLLLDASIDNSTAANVMGAGASVLVIGIIGHTITTHLSSRHIIQESSSFR